MKKYNVEVNDKILSLSLFSEELDFILAKEIKKEIGTTRESFQGKIEKAVIYLHETKFIDTSGISLLMDVYQNISSEVELIGCREPVADLIIKLKIDKFIKVI